MQEEGEQVLQMAIGYKKQMNGIPITGIDNKSTLHTLSIQWVCLFTTSMFSLNSTLKYNNAIHVPAVVSCRVQNCGERGRFHRCHRDCNFNVARWASTICFT